MRLAVTIPHTGGVAGTWAGDIVFNSNFRPKSVAQFKAVAMHESVTFWGWITAPAARVANVSAKFADNSASSGSV